MANKLDEIEAQALDLSASERAQLVSRLLASLDQDSADEVELAWIDEAERRYQEVCSDPAVAESSPVAFQRARNALK